jgi:hypothetical protein
MPTLSSTPQPDDVRPFAAQELNAAANRAADDILAALSATDEGPRDLVNLVVNATAYYVAHPGATLSEAIEASYSESEFQVLEWATR